MEHTAHSHLDQTTKLALRSTYHYNFPPHLRLPQQNTAFILHNGFGKGSVGLSFLVPDAHAIHDGLRHSSSNQQYSAVCMYMLIDSDNRSTSSTSRILSRSSYYGRLRNVVNGEIPGSIYKALRSAVGLRRPLRSLRKVKSTSNYAKRTEVHD